MRPLPQVIPVDGRLLHSGQQSTGIQREEAFASEDRWIGVARAEPGDWSGWHHHGDHDSYFYVLSGGLEFEYQVDDQHGTIEVGPDDFAFMPSRVVHRERTMPGDTGEVILVRIGHGPTVFNVDGPAVT